MPPSRAWPAGILLSVLCPQAREECVEHTLSLLSPEFGRRGSLPSSLLLPVTLEKTLESPLGCKEIQPVHSKGDQSWVFTGRTDTEAETPILWPLHVKSWLFGKDSDAGRDWGQEEKGTTEGEMAGWHHRLDGHEFGWTPGVGDGQGGLACCGSWGCKQSDTTEQLKWTELTPSYLLTGSLQSLTSATPRNPSKVVHHLVITSSHTIYPLAHQKYWNCVKSFISVLKKKKKPKNWHHEHPEIRDADFNSDKSLGLWNTQVSCPQWSQGSFHDLDIFFNPAHGLFGPLQCFSLWQKMR